MDQQLLPSEDIYNWLGEGDYEIRGTMIEWLDKLFESINNSNGQIALLNKRIEELESKLVDDEIDNPPHPKFGWSKSV